ncbi:hypothetical protein JCM15765_18240 [Paradesulfitobacterium aromaticivorans]
MKNKGIQFLRDRKNEVEVADRQELVHLSINPLLLNRMLAFGTMPIAAGVVRNLHRAALRTNLGMVSKFCGTAVTNHIEGFGLSRRHRIKTDVIKYILKLRHLNHIRHEDFLQRQYVLLIDEYS